MLTVFHTADWHLGQSFFGFDRDYEHQQFLDWLLEQLRSQKPNILVVAGDIFDTINPSAVAQRRFYDFLARAIITVPETRIIITAGNHDAAARLEAPAGLLESLNVTIVGTVQRQADGTDTDAILIDRLVIPVRDSSGCLLAVVVAVPFLRPSDVPLVPDSPDPMLAGVASLYQQALEAALKLRDASWSDKDAAASQGSGVSSHGNGSNSGNSSGSVRDIPVIALGHCHVQGGEESRDSERRLVIGGAEALPPDTFSQAYSYVALGHLHKAQQVGRTSIRYSGSPVPLSFSEATYRHRVLRLTFEGSRLASVDDLFVPRFVSFQTIPDRSAADIEAVLEQLAVLPDGSQIPAEQHPFLEVRILESGPDPSRRRRIEQALDGKAVRLASIKLESPVDPGSTPDPTQFLTIDDVRMMDPELLLAEVHRTRFGTEPDESLLRALKELMSQGDLS